MTAQDQIYVLHKHQLRCWTHSRVGFYTQYTPESRQRTLEPEFALCLVTFEKAWHIPLIKPTWSLGSVKAEYCSTLFNISPKLMTCLATRVSRLSLQILFQKGVCVYRGKDYLAWLLPINCSLGCWAPISS